jgi:hypothetical protein
MSGLPELLDELEGLLTEIDALDEPVRVRVPRAARRDRRPAPARDRPAGAGGRARANRARLVTADPAVAWLLEAYAVGSTSAPRPRRRSTE